MIEFKKYLDNETLQPRMSLYINGVYSDVSVALGDILEFHRFHGRNIDVPDEMSIIIIKELEENQHLENTDEIKSELKEYFKYFLNSTEDD